eukprot:CAMPEP_0167761536 /NCGR_PEP_ID=MMETSP0110_2-20121227/12231_1 /TAXON_ID=629695 /ORGANISM="Gymnochlora sp., Strain CCMP2014" /LENGTH=368 /DNA_ID=CAMNT_0007648239 /DNA_START=30 /DNA_END=1136 /DNA_ORIENTATION=-
MTSTTVQEHKLLTVINKESKTGEFKTPRGVTVCTREFTPTDGSKPKVLIFFHHGVKGHMHRAFIDEKGVPCNDLLLGRSVRERGWGLFSIDAEGHGFSEGLPFYIYDHPGCVRDFLAYVSATRKRFPNTPWFIMGESWGGNIALTAGLYLQDGQEEDRENWAGALLVAPAVAGNLPPAPVVFTLRYCCAPCCPKTVPFFMPNPVSADRIWKDDGVRKHMEEVDDIGGGGSPFRLGTAVSLLTATEVMQRRVSEIDYTFCVVHGGHDYAVIIEGSELLYNNSKTDSKRKVFETFDGAYHDLLADPDRLKIVKTLLDFADSYKDNPALPGKNEGTKRESIDLKRESLGAERNSLPMEKNEKDVEKAALKA